MGDSIFTSQLVELRAGYSAVAIRVQVCVELTVEPSLTLCLEEGVHHLPEPTRLLRV